MKSARKFFLNFFRKFRVIVEEYRLLTWVYGHLITYITEFFYSGQQLKISKFIYNRHTWCGFELS